MQMMYRPALVSLVAGVLLTACGGDKAKGPPPATVPEVGVLTLAVQPVQLYSELPGRVTALRTADIRPQVGGILQKRLFTEGTEVKAGQALYQIDPDTYRAAVSRARAALVSAEAQAANTRVIAQRYETLFSQHLANQQDRDNTAVAAARAEADVQVARAALESAQIDLNHTLLTAPIAGRIGRSLVTEGALLKAVQDGALATVQQIDTVYVDIPQSSAELLRLQHDLASGRLQEDAALRTRVTLTLEDGTRYALPGELRFSEVTVDSGTGSVILRAVFPNPQRELLPGMFVRAQVGQAANSAALLMPQAGVSRNARGAATVLVVGDDDVATERVITTGRVVNNQWLVTEGLKPGERVIVEGLQKAKPGAKVRPVAAGAATQAPASAGKG